jgi:predicted permease
METLLADLRYALRTLRKSPAFTAVAVLCLALGIGANTTMFGIIDRLFLQPPSGVRDPSGIVRPYLTLTAKNVSTTSSTSIGWLDYLVMRDATRSFSNVVGYDNMSVEYGQGANAQRLKGILATSNYFSTLGAVPAIGRFFAPDEGAKLGGHPVVILSHALWTREFGADRSIVGRPLTLNGKSYTVIGVGAAGFNGIDLSPVDLWAPMGQLEDFGAPASFLTSPMRDAIWLQTFARLKTGVTREQAASDVMVALRHAAESVDDADPKAIVEMGPINEALSPKPTQSNTVLLWLAAMTGVVLLIACANVANLLLVRASGRTREIAIRLSVGAARTRLVRQLVTESIVLALLGGAAAVVVAWWGARIVKLFPLPPMPGLIDARVLGFTFALAVATGLLFGIVPAVLATRADLTSGDRRAGARGSLLVVQVTLSLVLLVSAGLLVRSLRNMLSIDTGMQLDRLMIVGVDLAKAGYVGPARAAMYDRMLERVRALPGVEAASATRVAPFTGAMAFGIRLPGPDSVPYKGEGPYTYMVENDFHATVGLRVIAGRAFTSADRAGSPHVAIINARLAEAYFPGQNPIGKCVLLRFSPDEQRSCAEVIGVTPTGKYSRLKEAPIPVYYVPLAQRAPNELRRIIVRTAGPPAAMVDIVRRELQSLDARLPFIDVRPSETLLERQILPFRLGATMFSIFGGLALLLAAIGLYGVMAYAVTQRTRELGVRMALGAQARHVVGLVVGQGLRLTLLGVALGLGAAAMVTRRFGDLLYGVKAIDPATFAVMAIGLGTVALLASWIPARRAARVDPMVALRSD